MSSTDVLILRKNTAPTIGHATTAKEATPETDRITHQVNALDDEQTRETQEASDVRH
ncbi:hypothetical protein ACFWP5_01350 [Streptomyces sp. NPDC058469]|uniref:hypothetical protein n=1 Tax=Streptomyces sp. NPDC058469 TaxID=3346514 RepID=UPI00365B8965